MAMRIAPALVETLRWSAYRPDGCSMDRKIAPRGGICFRISPNRPLLLVEVDVNGHGPFNFVLDTGASFCVITPDTAKAAGVQSTGKSPAAVGAGGLVKASLAKLKTLRLGPRTARNLGAAMMSLDEVEKRLGVPIDGLIGYNFLKSYVVTIDYPQRRLFLKQHKADKRKTVKR
jgi:predicted aspartyl protease